MAETGVSYFNERTLRHVREDLRDMVEHGCTYVVHCLTEGDLLWYRDTMRDVVEATHDAGLEAWLDPWAVMGIFGGESLSRFLLDHPEAWQVDTSGRRYPAACPNHPETRRYMREWIRACADIGGDVVFWDEPHFAGAAAETLRAGGYACYCDWCQQKFRRSARRPMPPVMNEEVRRFRELFLLEFLTEMCGEAKRLGLRNALCLIPTDFEAAGLTDYAARVKNWWKRLGVTRERPWLEFGIADWDAAASIAGLDIFGCDPYWFAAKAEPEPFVRAFSRRAVAIAREHGLQSQIWVQAFSVPEGREAELAMGVRVAVEEGATHVAAWSYRGTESMSAIRCARPDVVWETLGRAFRQARGLA